MQTEPIATPIDVLDFWFGTEPHARVARPEWFRKSADFDAEIRRRFGVTHDTARAGGLITWESALRDRLALIVVLDQFSRNLHRDSPLAFACDARALALARQTVDERDDLRLSPLERSFVYLPFEHAEDGAAQETSLRLFALLEAFPETAGTLEWARRHALIIERFGRFPHRNVALGRTSTPEEMAFLTEPGSRF